MHRKQTTRQTLWHRAAPMQTESGEGGEVRGQSFHSYRHTVFQYKDQRRQCGELRGIMGKMRGEALLPCSSEAIQSHGYHGYYGHHHHHHNITTVPRLEKHAAPFWVSLLAALVERGKETREGRSKGGWRLKIRSLTAACRRWWELWWFGTVRCTSHHFHKHLFILILFILSQVPH